MAIHTRSDAPESAYILKILYGPLCGLELPLAAGRHFFVSASATDADTTLDRSALVDAQRCYVIPGLIDVPASLALPNYAIEFEPGHDAWIEIFETRAPSLRDASDDKDADLPIGFCARVGSGRVFDHHGVRIAWRSVDTPWPDDMRAPDSQAAFAIPATPEADPARREVVECPPGSLDRVQSADGSGNRSKTHRPLHRAIGLLATLSVVAASAAIALQPHTARAQASTDSIETALRGAPNPCLVHLGRDKRLYVIVRSERDAAWAAQALRWIAGPKGVDVRVESDEARRVEALLERQAVAFYAVRFDAARGVELILIDDPHLATPVDTATLRRSVLAALPYIDDVRIERRSRSYVLAKAKIGLDALNVQYRQSQRGTLTTFELDGSLDDARLSELGNFAQVFARDWGRQGVRFILDSPTDPMQAHTYRVRTQRYFSTGPDAIEFISPVS